MRSITGAFALASGFVLIVVLAGGGCYTTLCEDRGIPLVDNRDRKAYPTIDEDWVCTRAYAESYYELPKPPPPPPPPPLSPPDVTGDHPASSGPKDPDGVVNSAIVVNSCFGHLYFFRPMINTTIQSTYFEQLRNQTSHALFQRTDCFKDKANGCEALRECLGLVQQINGSPAMNVEIDNVRHSECMGDTGIKYSHNNFYDAYDVYYDVYTWFNCGGLGLTCDDEYHREWCGTPRTPCNPDVDTYTCWDTRPFYCERPAFGADEPTYYWQEPRCGDFGLVCASEVLGGPPDCVGEGAACEVDPTWSNNLAYYSFREGVACESETMMRACVGRGEHLVDCAQLGKGFTCIPGTPTRCGLAAECDASDPVQCEGDSLVVCDAGKIRKVDCKSLGFTSCDAKHKVCSPGVYDNLP